MILIFACTFLLFSCNGLEGHDVKVKEYPNTIGQLSITESVLGNETASISSEEVNQMINDFLYEYYRSFTSEEPLIALSQITYNYSEIYQVSDQIDNILSTTLEAYNDFQFGTIQYSIQSIKDLGDSVYMVNVDLGYLSQENIKSIATDELRVKVNTDAQLLLNVPVMYQDDLSDYDNFFNDLYFIDMLLVTAMSSLDPETVILNNADYSIELKVLNNSDRSYHFDDARGSYLVIEAVMTS